MSGLEASRCEVWQLGAGTASRSYAGFLVRHGLALIGPGDAGPWTPERPDEDFGGGYVRRFASELQVGDVLLLRTGLSTIHAVGLVAGGYEHLEQFDDVNGWDLQHARRVRWQALAEPHDFGTPVFGANPPRLSRVRNGEVLEFVKRFLASPPFHWQEAPLPPLPAPEPALEDVPVGIAEVVATARDLALLFRDAEGFGEPPAEGEMIAHFVVPLLRGLGWPAERIAVEWRRVDVAVFTRLPRSPEHCNLVIEAKRFGAGTEEALEQARGYVEALGARCDVVVTDGIRYRLYARDSGYEPVAYANLACLKRPAMALFRRLSRA